MNNSRVFKKMVKYLLIASRGGPMRARIINVLIEMPRNPNQLADLLKVDYKTITHHLGVLKKNNWVTGSEDKYGVIFKSPFTNEEKEAFNEVWIEIGKKL